MLHNLDVWGVYWSYTKIQEYYKMLLQSDMFEMRFFVSARQRFAIDI